MANYIAWYGKKLERLAEIEREFEALLKNGVVDSKLQDAAEEVRAAQIRALKSKRAEMPPSEVNADIVAHCDREIEFWLGLSQKRIIDGYRTGNLRKHRATAVRS